MAVYEWHGIDASGRKTKGVRDAESPKALRGILKRDGVLVTEIIEESKARSKRAREIDLRKFFRRVSTVDVAMATRQLATLLRSGIPLVEALTALIDQLDQPEFKSALTQARDRVNEGSTFADALRAHPKLFSTLYVNMVAAGEASGTLEIVLARLADFLEAQASLRNKIASAIAYPAFMAVMSVIILTLMMAVVVPKVTTIFEGFNQSLPWYTRLMLAISNFMTSFWWLLIMLLGLAIYGFIRWRNTEEGRTKWDKFVLSVPIGGTLITMVAVSRFARTLSTLLSSGVQVLQAMEITRNVLGNTELMRVVEEARSSVREGESIAKPLKASGRFPPIVIHMIAIGERSGQLEELLQNVATSYDSQVEAKLATMTSLLAPLVIVMMGGVAAAIAFSVLMPILQINEFIQ